MGCCHHYQFNAGGDDLFTIDVNRIRFGPAALRELGAEVALDDVKKAAVFTDTVVQQRLLSVSPREVQEEDLRKIYSAALRYW